MHHDGVTPNSFIKFALVAPKKTKTNIFSIFQRISAHSKVRKQNNAHKNNKKSMKTRPERSQAE